MSFHRDNKAGGNRGKKYARKDSDDRSFSAGDSGKPAFLHKTTCTACNQECEVPFKPISGKPVYCRDCFSKKRDKSPRESEGRDYGERKFGGGGVMMTQEQFKTLNSKLDQIIEALEDL